MNECAGHGKAVSLLLLDQVLNFERLLLFGLLGHVNMGDVVHGRIIDLIIFPHCVDSWRGIEDRSWPLHRDCVAVRT